MDKLKLIEAIMGSGSSSNELPYEVGQKVFIRTVTHHLVGRISAIRGKFLILEEAAWVADDGIFNECINQGKLDEVEPINVPITTNTDSFIDSYRWDHALPRDVK